MQDSIESDRLFVDGQYETAGIAENFVTGARRMDAQRAGGDMAMLVPLAAGENEDVFVAFVIVAGVRLASW